MGFESEPTLHSGINYAVLLLAAGHQFETSFELRKVGEWVLDWISVTYPATVLCDPSNPSRARNTTRKTLEMKVSILSFASIC